MVTVQTGEDNYRLVCGDDEGELTEYGEVATVESGGVCYVSLIDVDESGELESALGDDWVYVLSKTPLPYEKVEVDFQDADEIEEEEGAGEVEVEED